MEIEAREPYESTYQPRITNNLVIKNVTILDGKGAKLLQTDVSISAGEITKIAKNIVDDQAKIIDGVGKWLTPGIIDVHSHLGVYPSPSINATSDGNESTSPNTARVWAEHSVWPQDPQFGLALAGGVTTLQILPGSANLFG